MGDIRDQIDGYWDELEEPATEISLDALEQLNLATKKWVNAIFQSGPLLLSLKGKMKDYTGGQTIPVNFLYDPIVATKNLKVLGEVVSGNSASWDGSKYATYGTTGSTTASTGTEWVWAKYLALPDKGSTGGNDK